MRQLTVWTAHGYDNTLILIESKNKSEKVDTNSEKLNTITNRYKKF